MYATEADLTAWLEGGDYATVVPEDPTRILARAWEVIDDHTLGAYERAALTGLATDPVVVEALTSAQCAQVEQWLEVGEENDVAGFPKDTFMSGGVSVNRQPDELAPRAARILRRCRTTIAPNGLLIAAPITVALE